ncbi:cation:proton antiporter [Amycolatopsis coloradensis]|nr:cation:proton antiporter [Amycolatopsis coloradensis]
MKPDLMLHVLFALAVIVAAAQIFGAIARRMNQPAVIGEIAAGILLGPTLFDGALSDSLFPEEIRPLLSTLANIGIALFMFAVGTEVDRRLLRGNRLAAVTVSISSVVVPFAFGCALATYLVLRHPTTNGLAFVLFVGTAMSVTAFPVLARILTDRGLSRTPTGALALSAAAVADLVAWSVLALIATLVGGAQEQSWRIALAVPFGAIMFFVVRPLLGRVGRAMRTDQSRGRLLVVAIPGLLLSGAATEWIGLHFIFGAFLFGLVMPRGEHGRIPGDGWEGVQRISGVLLLPVYFVVAGLNVDLSTIAVANLVELGLIVLLSVGGKYAGTIAGARLHRIPWRQATILATLMNTRGLTELIVLTVGLQLGVLDHGLFSLMVLMALLTTAMAGPLLNVLNRGDRAVGALPPDPDSTYLPQPLPHSR